MVTLLYVPRPKVALLLDVPRLKVVLIFDVPQTKVVRLFATKVAISGTMIWIRVTETVTILETTT